MPSSYPTSADYALPDAQDASKKSHTALEKIKALEVRVSNLEAWVDWLRKEAKNNHDLAISAFNA